MSGTLRSSLAEFLGTFALVWLSASAACADAASGGHAGPLGAALAYGLALAMLTYAFSSVDAGYFNPALTAGLCLTRRLDPVRAVFLGACQLLGAGCAGMFLVRSYHAGAVGGVCALHGVGYRMGTLIEAMTTFWLVFTFCAARLERRDAAGCAALGAAAAAASLATSTLTGGAFNPARAFGPAVATGQWANWYVYWAGPLVGACAAALLYEHLFLEKK
jgi:glycerol uptake facilitator protein